MSNPFLFSSQVERLPADSLRDDAIVSLLGCLFSALTNNAVQLGLARAFLGLGIGPNSATTPMFAAECSPPKIRGALVMVSSVGDLCCERETERESQPKANKASPQ